MIFKRIYCYFFGHKFDWIRNPTWQQMLFGTGVRCVRCDFCPVDAKTVSDNRK